MRFAFRIGNHFGFSDGADDDADKDLRSFVLPQHHFCQLYARARVMGSYPEIVATSLRPGPGGYSAVKPAAPLIRHNPHDARSSGSGPGATPRSEFALQRQPSVRQAAFEHLATPMPFTTGSFRACASGSRTAYNG